MNAGSSAFRWPVQRVTRVLAEREQILRQERDVVEGRVRLVSLVEDRQLPGVRRRVLLRQLEDRRPAAAAVVLRARRTGVARLVEVELLEMRAGPEQAVLRPLERRPGVGPRRGVGVE